MPRPSRMASLPPRSVNVDTPEKPKRPWYRKKRWQAVAAVWLALPPLYALSWGPAYYSAARGWWQWSPAVYRPVHFLKYECRIPGISDALWSYDAYWRRIARPHWMERQAEKRREHERLTFPQQRGTQPPISN
jgi:hypothetical protein